jgi:hypothetical protein
MTTYLCSFCVDFETDAANCEIGEQFFVAGKPGHAE